MSNGTEVTEHRELTEAELDSVCGSKRGGIDHSSPLAKLGNEVIAAAWLPGFTKNDSKPNHIL